MKKGEYYRCSEEGLKELLADIEAAGFSGDITEENTEPSGDGFRTTYVVEVC